MFGLVNVNLVEWMALFVFLNVWFGECLVWWMFGLLNVSLVDAWLD